MPPRCVRWRKATKPWEGGGGGVKLYLPGLFTLPMVKSRVFIYLCTTVVEKATKSCVCVCVWGGGVKLHLPTSIYSYIYEPQNFRGRRATKPLEGSV